VFYGAAAVFFVIVFMLKTSVWSVILLAITVAVLVGAGFAWANGSPRWWRHH
jgi:hypothetical protein